MTHLLTIKEAAKMLAVHPNTLRNWEADGKIKVTRLGSRRDRRYNYEDILKLTNYDGPRIKTD